MIFKKHIQVLNIPYGTPEWYSYRNTGIGGSEMYILLGYSDYDHPARIFYEKIGLSNPSQVDNVAMFHGRMDEEKVALLWSYTDNSSEESYIKNYNEGKKLKSYRKINGFIVNDKYPNFFASVDRYIPKGNMSFVSSKHDKPYILECKTISGFASDKWELGIPPWYPIQVHCYMLVTELDYAEIAVLIDGRHFRIYPILRNDAIIDMILEKHTEFWRKVEQAKSAIKEYDYDLTNKELLKYISSLEPEPDSSSAYTEFLSEKFKLRELSTSIVGTPELLELSINDKMLLEVSKQVKTKRTEYQNVLKNEMANNNANEINFGAEGCVKLNKRGNSFTFKNDIKTKIDIETINLNDLLWD